MQAFLRLNACRRDNYMKAAAIIVSIILFSGIEGRADDLKKENLQKPATGEQITPLDTNAIALALSPSAFSASPQDARSRLFAATKYKRMDDGRSINKGDLSKPVAAAVERLGCIVIPNVDFRQAPPKDILRFIAAAQTIPEPDKTRAVGLIHEQTEPDFALGTRQATELLDELVLDETP